MQLFAEYGYENGGQGLGFIKGTVERIKTKLKLPHLGWNEVNFKKKNELFNGIENKKDFYFVHSYYFECLNSEDNLASTNYDFEFSSIIRKNNVVGYQFHPEKSLKNGLKLLNNFLNI